MTSLKDASSRDYIYNTRAGHQHDYSAASPILWLVVSHRNGFRGHQPRTSNSDHWPASNFSQTVFIDNIAKGFMLNISKGDIIVVLLGLQLSSERYRGCVRELGHARQSLERHVFSPHFDFKDSSKARRRAVWSRLLLSRSDCS